MRSHRERLRWGPRPGARAESAALFLPISEQFATPSTVHREKMISSSAIQRLVCHSNPRRTAAATAWVRLRTPNRLTAREM